MTKSRLTQLLLAGLLLMLLLAVPVWAGEHADECQDSSGSNANAEECEQQDPNGEGTSAAQEPAPGPSPSPTEGAQETQTEEGQTQTVTAEEGSKLTPSQESTAPPGEQGNIQTSGTCLLEVIFRGFDTGPSTVITNVFAVPPSGDGLIFTNMSEEVMARRERGNTVSLVKTYDLSGSVGGLQPSAGGFQVRIEVHVTGPDGRTTTRTKVDRLPCIVEGQAVGPRVLPVEILGPRILPETGVNVSDYLIISIMMFITGASFLRRARLS